MDDPWGSPWALANSPSDHEPPRASRANSFLSPPPKAFFGNGAGSSPHSPWPSVQDDGFGVWATADKADGTDSQNGWSAWADSGVQPPRLSPRLSSSGEDRQLTWPENAAPSPVFIGNSRSRTPSILRHHSPDPWAAELPLTRRSIEPSASPKIAATNAPIEPPEQTSLTYQTTTGLEIGGNPDKEGPPVEVQTILEETSANEPTERQSADSELYNEHPDAGPKLDVTVHEPPSRPSSVCTIDSHDVPERQDSPITSIDEDRGARIQTGSLKASGQVQELGGVYNDLARVVSKSPPPSRPGTSRTASRGKLTEQNKDEDSSSNGFGKIEHALEKNGGVIRPLGEVSSFSGFLATPKAEFEDDFTRETEPEEKEGHASISETISQDAARKTWDVSFDTNLALVDELFPDLPASFLGGTTGDKEVSDHVVSDSFETISERKAWYRISRFGSMRKHNSGDDENYHKVSWPTCQLHSDTIHIVRRWMEEDSYAGKPTLGGTKRTGFFDWDSDAAPVELGEVFRRKKPETQHLRTTSIPASSVVKSAAAGDRPYRNSIGIAPPPELQPINSPVSGFARTSEDKGTHPKPPFGHSISPLPSPAPTPADASIHRPAPIQVSSVDEDDDEWGEMVSSPSAAEHTVPNVRVLSLANIPAEPNGPTRQQSLPISGAKKTADPKLRWSQDMQPKRSSPWSFSDILALDKPGHVVSSMTPGPSDTGHGFAIPEARVPVPSGSSLTTLDQESVGGSKILHEGLVTNQTAIGKDTAESVPQRRPSVPSIPVVSIDDKGQDDIIVQNILQNLPDLSYMLR